MNERRRPPRRGRGPRSGRPPVTERGRANPYRESPVEAGDAPIERAPRTELAPPRRRHRRRAGRAPASSGGERTHRHGRWRRHPAAPAAAMPAPRPERRTRRAPIQRSARTRGHQRAQNGRRGRRNRGRGRREQGQASGVRADRAARRRARRGIRRRCSSSPTGETTGWFDPARDGGFIRRAQASYLADAGDAYVPPHLVRQYALRKSDEIARHDGPRPARPHGADRDPSINGEPPGERARASRVQHADRVVSGAEAVPRDGPSGEGRPRADAPRDRSHRADRLRPARADRRAGARRQDDAAARDHRRHRDQPSRRRRCSSCSWTSVPRK